MNIIGRILFIFLYISNFVYPVSLDLKLLSMDGGILKEAGAGQPFMAYVTVTEAQNITSRPTLHHSHDINVRANGYQMNMINGNTTVVYQFQVRIDTPGTFVIGPARLTHESKTIESNTISLTVTQEQKVDQLKKASASTSNNFFRLTADKQRAYVGEKITCQLTFYTNDNNVSLQAIYDPDQLEKTGFTCKQKSEPINGVTKVEGTDYRYAQWEFETYATKSGSLILPAYAVDFICQTNRGMFAMLFAHHDVKRLYSNTLTLSIDPLPQGKRIPSFVGTISQFNAKITPAHSHVGKGMILSLTITGQGNFDAIPFIPLINMNEDFKWYESKQYTQPGKDGEKTHVMEYVIQATQAGTYSIPNQELFYFDTKERTYKLIKTLEIPIHIRPGAPLTSSKPSQNLNEIKQEPQLMLCTNYDASTTPFIPWNIYWIIISCMGVVGLLWHTWHYIPRLRLPSTNKISCKRFKKEILEIGQMHKYESLYSLFTHFCSQQAHMKSQQISADEISAWLRQSGLSSSLVQEWDIFFQEVSQLRFDKPGAINQTENIIKRALYWLDILNTLPRGNQ